MLCTERNIMMDYYLEVRCCLCHRQVLVYHRCHHFLGTLPHQEDRHDLLDQDCLYARDGQEIHHHQHPPKVTNRVQVS